MTDVKSYRPATNSIGSGQVLQCPYSYEKAKLIVQEMTDLLVLDLVDKGLVTDQVVLTIGYDIENLTNPEICKLYKGEVVTDHYGRKIPKHAHGTANIGKRTSSTMLIMDAVMKLYSKISDPGLLVRRVNIVANHITEDGKSSDTLDFEQLDLFTDYEALRKQRQEEDVKLQKEKQIQLAMLSIKKKYGKNAILKGTNLEEGAMTQERNNQIGGHKA